MRTHFLLAALSLLPLPLVACGGDSNDESHSNSDGGADSGDGASSTTPKACPVGALNALSNGYVAGTRSLAADGTDLFYTTIPDPSASFDDPHYLMRLSAAGGTPNQLATGTTGTSLSSLVLDGSDVYFFMDKTLSKIPKAGGAATKVYARTGIDSITMTFAVDDASIYFIDASGLSKMGKDGTSPTSLFKDDKIHVTGLALDADAVYFVGSPPISFAADAGPPGPDQLYSIPKSGGTPKSLASITSDPNLEETIWQLSVDGTTLVYSTNTALLKAGVTTQFALYAVPTSGGAVTTLAKLGDADGPAFAAQGGTAYYGGNLGTVFRVAETGGAPTKIASTSDGLGAVALDASNVYYEVRGCFFKSPR